MGATNDFYSAKKVLREIKIQKEMSEETKHHFVKLKDVLIIEGNGVDDCKHIFLVMEDVLTDLKRLLDHCQDILITDTIVKKLTY